MVPEHGASRALLPTQQKEDDLKKGRGLGHGGKLEQ